MKDKSSDLGNSQKSKLMREVTSQASRGKLEAREATGMGTGQINS